MNREVERERALKYIQDIQEQILEIDGSNLSLKTKKELIERLTVDIENFFAVIQRMELAEAEENSCGCGCGCSGESDMEEECDCDCGCNEDSETEEESEGCGCGCGGHETSEDEEAEEIQVLVLNSEEDPFVAIIPDTFEALYEIMGTEELVMERMEGYEEYIMILNPNDEPKEENEEYMGTIIICRIDENQENLDSLNDEDIERLLEMFA